MVGFGKSLVLGRRPGWEDAYLNYNQLKMTLNTIEQQVMRTRRVALFGSNLNHDRQDANSDSEALPLSTSSFEDAENLNQLKQTFFQQLHIEIEKISLFSLKQQGHLADAVGSLRFDAATSTTNNSSQLFEGFHNSYENKNPLDAHAALGVELMHLLRYLCVNSIGIRKILKKYNKIFERLDEPHYYNVVGDHHIHQLAWSQYNQQSNIAIQATLQSTMVDYYNEQQQLATENTQQQFSSLRLSFLRFQCIMECVNTIRRNSQIMNQPFFDFLTRQAMIVTYNNFGGMNGTYKHILEWLLRLNPDDMLTMSAIQLETVWSRWAGGGTTTSPSKTTTKTATKATDTAASLPKSQRQLATILEEDFDDIMSDNQDDDGRRYPWGGIDSACMILNLCSTALYTINYYIVAPTANHYAIKLGRDGAYGASMIGASSFSALFAAFFYSLWYTRSTIKSALICSALFPLIGNLLYSLAISYHSMTMAIVGRILCGFGSAEVVNRQVISACVSFEGMTKASALFVAAGAIGMSIGPLLAAILDTYSGRDVDVDLELPFMPAGGIIYDHITAPGFVMASLWFLQLMGLLTLFREPSRINGSQLEENVLTFGHDSPIDDESGGKTSGDETDVISSYQKLSSGERTTSNMSKKSSDSIRESGIWQEIVVTYRLVVQNPGLPVTMLVFGYIELADEVLISSCSMVVRRYFEWHGSAAGFLIASLGSLVLPAHFVVERAARYYSERRIMIRSTVFIILSILGILNYNAVLYDMVGIWESENPFVERSKQPETVEIAGQQLDSLLTKDGEFLYYGRFGALVYVICLSLFFMGTIILEGVDTSIMAKITPSKLNDRFINSGLLATLVGTLGRVLADVMITLSALFDVYLYVDFVNATFLPLLILALAALYLLNKFYQNFA